MTEAVIASYARTPIGKAYKGSLNATPGATLGAHAVAAAVTAGRTRPEDNGSAHRGKRSIDRLQGTRPNLILVHTPVHASWLNQAEIYFSIAQSRFHSPRVAKPAIPTSR